MPESAEPRAVAVGLSEAMRRYYLGPDHPFKLRLWTWVRRASGYPRLTLRYAERGVITVDERDFVQFEIFSKGMYEPEVWDALAAHAAGGDVVWDIGAHIGGLTLRAALDGRVREVHAFEPNPAARRVLASHIRLNGLAHCRVHPLALSDRAGTAVVLPGPATNTGQTAVVTNGTRGAETAAGGETTVECETIDRLVFDRGLAAPTLVKIDAEGLDNAIIRGAARLLASRPPRAIVFETAVDASGAMTDASLRESLAAAGYEMTLLRRASSVEGQENFLASRQNAPARP